MQEKVATIRHDRIDLYIVGFGRSKKLHKVPYNYGMNKYYWVNIPDTNIFYLLPEDELLKHNLLFESTEKTLPMLSIKITDDKKWYNNYKYNYDTINKKDFMKLFEIEE